MKTTINLPNSKMNVECKVEKLDTNTSAATFKLWYQYLNTQSHKMVMSTLVVLEKPFIGPINANYALVSGHH